MVTAILLTKKELFAYKLLGIVYSHENNDIFKFQFIAPSSLPYEGRWPGECRVGGVKAYQFCGTKANLSPLSRLRRQLPSEGSLGSDKSQFAFIRWRR